jgi:ADP-ribose pyrophosphatase
VDLPEGVELWDGPIRDEVDPRPVVSSQRRFRGRVIGLRTDQVDFGSQVVPRDVVEHPGAVGVLALDDDGRVLLLRQYRHPVGAYLWEPPAGLTDVAGEDPLVTAKRELLEETGYVAQRWERLVSFFNSPGGMDEHLTLYLAQGLRPAARVHTGEAEEASMPIAWVPLDEAIDLVLHGHIENPTAVVGILAAAARLRPTARPGPP